LEKDLLLLLLLLAPGLLERCCRNSEADASASLSCRELCWLECGLLDNASAASGVACRVRPLFLTRSRSSSFLRPSNSARRQSKAHRLPRRAHAFADRSLTFKAYLRPFITLSQRHVVQKAVFRLTLKQRNPSPPQPYHIHVPLHSWRLVLDTEQQTHTGVD